MPYSTHMPYVHNGALLLPTKQQRQAKSARLDNTYLLNHCLAIKGNVPKLDSSSNQKTNGKENS